MNTQTIDDKDHAALELALVVARDKYGLGAKIDHMLKHRSWFAAAQSTAATCQAQVLRLKPWQLPPVFVDVGEDPECDALWGRMKACNVSKYDPNPIEACKAAERLQR
jgi:hypothetical protein